MALFQKAEKGAWRTPWVVNQDGVKKGCQRGRRGDEVTETKTGRETETESAVTGIKTETGIGIEGETGTEIGNISVTVAIGTVGNEGKIDTCPPRVIKRVWAMVVKKVRNEFHHNQRKVHRMGCE